MLLALISDIHANIPAFNAVLNAIDAINPDKIICLGDVVGYGPEPNEAIDILREREIPTVMGNHDAAVAGLYSLRSFREPNHTLLKITRGLLTDENKSWLAHLPRKIENDTWVAAHASPVIKDEWPYLNSALKCMDTLAQIKQNFCFIGHTHRPGIVSNQFGILKLQPGFRFVINPGSVGQSRNIDKRACFCTVNTETYEHILYRISYEFGETLAKYESIGLKRDTGKQLLHLDRNFG